MPSRHGPRFALEAGFLILLAVLTGLADLRWQAIVLVMAIAWLLIALLEWAFWREGPRLPPVPRSYAPWAPPAAPPAPEPVRPPLPPREEATRIIEPDELVELPAAEPTAEAEPEAAEPAKRRWFRRGRKAAAEDAQLEEPAEPEGEAAAQPPVPDSAPVEGEPAAGAAPEPALAPDEAVPRRPWWWRRRDPDTELEPAQPRHVRVLPPERERDEE